MSHRFSAVFTGLVAVLVVVGLVARSAAGQAPVAEAEEDAFAPSQTPWGDPNLQGIWSPFCSGRLAAPRNPLAKVYKV